MVEVLGRYSNRADQGKRVQALLQSVPETFAKPKARTTKRVVRRLAPGQIDELAQAYEAGATLSDLSERFQQTRKTLSRALERRGVARRYRLISDDDTAKARSAYESGQTLSEIGEELGVSRDTVRRALIKDGVPMRPSRYGSK